MKKNLVFSVVAMLWFVGSVMCFSAAEMHAPLFYSPGMYGLSVYSGFYYGITAGNKTVCALHLSPMILEGKKPDAAEDVVASMEDTGTDTTIVRLKGRTTGCICEVEHMLFPDRLVFNYTAEARMKMDQCTVSVEMVGAWIAGKDYEWGPRPGVPEEKGTISAEVPVIDNPPGYFKIFDMDGRDVTLAFDNAETVVVSAPQWHMYGKGHPEQCALIFSVTPKGMKRNQPFEQGTVGSVGLKLSFAPRASLHIEKGLVDTFESKQYTWGPAYGGISPAIDAPGAAGTQYCLKCTLDPNKSFGGVGKLFPSPERGSTLFSFWARGDEDLKTLTVMLQEAGGGRFDKTVVLAPDWKKYGFSIQDMGYGPGPYNASKARPGDFSRVSKILCGWDFGPLKPDIAHSFRIDEISFTKP